MPIRHCIVHLIDKKPDGSPSVLHARDSELATSQAMENLLADLNESYNAKQGKAWGLFHEESGAYPFSGWLKAYLDGELDFTAFSRQAVEHLQKLMEESNLSTGGHVLLAHYQQGMTDYLAIALLHHSEGVAVTDALDVTPAKHLDLGQLHLAARINISEWQNNKQSKQYISFIKGKNGKKVSDYFRDFIGCQEGVDGPGDVVHGVGKNGPRPVAEPDRGRFIPGLAFDTNPLGRILYISASVAGRSVKANVAIALAPESGCRWRGGGGTPGGGVGDPDVAPSGIGFVIVQQQLGVEVSGDTHRWFRFADGRSRAKPYNVAAVTVGNG